MFHVNLSAFKNNFQPKHPRSGRVLSLAGLLLIILGVLIVLIPSLLEVIIASVLILLGITLFSWGWRLKKLEQNSNSIFDSFLQ